MGCKLLSCAKLFSSSQFCVGHRATRPSVLNAATNMGIAPLSLHLSTSHSSEASCGDDLDGDDAAVLLISEAIRCISRVGDRGFATAV